MTATDINLLFEKFAKTRVLLIGDAMIDAYMWGAVERMSPEAPVPVVNVTKREKRLGGAGNVAINLNSLGAEVWLCSLVGNDDNAQTLRQLLQERNLTDAGLFEVEGRPTTIKTRIISRDKHVLRVDEEVTSDLPNYSGFIGHLSAILNENEFDVIILQDYNKGTLNPVVIDAVTEIALRKNIPTAVDPKKKNFLAYRKVSLFKPNLKEIQEGLSIEIDPTRDESLEAAAQKLQGELNCHQVMITLSEHGVYITNGTSAHHHPAHPRKIIDVSGAGDTVISVASLALAQGVESSKLAQLANLAGGIVCEEVGVVPIDKQRLKEEAIKCFGFRKL